MFIAVYPTIFYHLHKFRIINMGNALNTSNNLGIQILL